jgi:hypothetical protein
MCNIYTSKKAVNNYIFSHSFLLTTYMDMKEHVLYSTIKIEIDINNDELLKTIFEHMKGKRGGLGHILLN